MEMFSLNEIYTSRNGIIVTLDLSVFLNERLCVLNNIEATGIQD